MSIFTPPPLRAKPMVPDPLFTIPGVDVGHVRFVLFVSVISMACIFSLVGVALARLFLWSMIRSSSHPTVALMAFMGIWFSLGMMIGNWSGRRVVAQTIHETKHL